MNVRKRFVIDLILFDFRFSEIVLIFILFFYGLFIFLNDWKAEIR